MIKYVCIVVLCFLATAQALVLHIMNIDDISTIAISEMHFVAPGNDFAGVMIIRDYKTLDQVQTIFAGESLIRCMVQVRGLYYNNQRGERLWPLDGETAQLLKDKDASYEDLSISGGWYRQCIGPNIHPETIIGQIEFDHNDTQTYLLAGINIDYAQNSYNLPVSNSLQYLANQLLGYAYDTVGGIAFVGGLFANHEAVLESISEGSAINQIFMRSGGVFYADGSAVITADNTLSEYTGLLIGIQGIIASTQNISAQQTQQLLSQYAGLVLPTTSFTTADITNQLRRKSNQLCQGRPQSVSVHDTSTILCFLYPSYSPAQQIHIDISNNTHANKTIFVKNANVVLQGTMTNTSSPLNIFVDNGNIQRNTSGAILQDFDIQGNPLQSSGVAQGVFLKGNIIIDGLLLPAQESHFLHKTYIHGKWISLHVPSNPGEGNIAHITNKFGAGFEDMIGLDQLFVRECNNGIGTDGTNCATLTDPYRFYPLIVVDRYIATAMY